MHSIRLNIDGLEQNETQDKVRNQLEGLVGVGDVYLSAGQTYVDINYDNQITDGEI